MVSCESLEDTYKDYAGDGPIRYLGKCMDLTVQPGWNRLIVSWTNSADPVIDKIKVTWSKDGVIKNNYWTEKQPSLIFRIWKTAIMK